MSSVLTGPGCGGGGAASHSRSETASSSPAADEREPTGGVEVDDGMKVEGTLGVLTPSQIEKALASAKTTFEQCVEKRRASLEVLSGSLELAFHIAGDGKVKWVYPSKSTLGEIDTESCILDAARSARFPKPRGGSDAEFRYPLEFPAAADVRAPGAWDEAKVAKVLGKQGAKLRASCGTDASIDVTAYVATRGKVIASGAAVDRPDIFDVQSCVAQGVRTWRFPEPGSYPAKVTFRLP